jgi:hypothetical protein
MLPAVEVGSMSYEKGAFQQLWRELTAREHSAFEKQMVTALTECPWLGNAEEEIDRGWAEHASSSS